jgi:hypothetical protein
MRLIVVVPAVTPLPDAARESILPLRGLFTLAAHWNSGLLAGHQREARLVPIRVKSRSGQTSWNSGTLIQPGCFWCSFTYVNAAMPICRRLLRQAVCCAPALTFASVGNNNPARIAMMAMTASSSINVKTR